MTARHTYSCLAIARRHPKLFAALRHGVAVVAVAVVTACGGGDGGAPFDVPMPSPSAPVSTCVPKVVRVALPGDSTQYGYDSATNALAIHNPGDELQAVLDAKFGVGSTVVTDYGVPGTQSSQVPHMHADVIVANYGINDMRNGTTLPVFAAQMKAIGATIIETPNPIWIGWSAGIDQFSYVQAAESVGVPVADVYEYVLQMPDWRAKMVDGVHPIDSLYKDIVDNVLAPAVEAQVAPLRCVGSAA